MKCSNCGAEMSNLNMTWGRKQLWIMIPILLLGFLPLLKLTFFKGDAAKELVISDVQKRNSEATIELVGLITNKSGHQWSSVTLEAEFFDASGAFIDEFQQYLKSDIAKGAKEHFKMSFKTSSPALTAPDTKMVLKVSGGHSAPF